MIGRRSDALTPAVISLQASYESVRPLFTIGDSHNVGLQGLLLRRADTNVPIAVGHPFYIPGMRASWAINDEGRIFPGVVDALCGACVLGHEHPPEREDLRIEQDGRVLGPHIWAQERHVMFVLGEIDARWVIRAVPLEAELDLPFEADLSALPGFAAAQWVSAAMLQEKILGFFRPFFRMLVKLQEIGLPRLAVASLPPPTPDDDEYFRYHGFPSRARTRYGVTMFINSLLRSFCAQSGILFVDIWNDVTHNNVVKPGWLMDGLHLSAPGNATLLAHYFGATSRLAVPA